MYLTLNHTYDRGEIEIIPQLTIHLDTKDPLFSLQHLQHLTSNVVIRLC